MTINCLGEEMFSFYKKQQQSPSVLRREISSLETNLKDTQRQIAWQYTLSMLSQTTIAPHYFLGTYESGSFKKELEILKKINALKSQLKQSDQVAGCKEKKEANRESVSLEKPLSSKGFC